MLIPKSTKYRRYHRISYEGRAKGHTKVNFGQFGLQAQTGAWVTNRQIEAARIAMNRHMKRGGKVWINIFPHLSKTKKPQEVRMGSGKGSPDSWVAVVKKGTVMFEVSHVNKKLAQESLRLAMYKLPVKCKILAREEATSEK